MTQINLAETAALLRERDHFLILTHKKPDGDTLGSAAALCRGLRAMGKTAHILPNPDITPRYAPFVARLTARKNTPAPETVVSVDIADVSLLPDNAEKYAESVYLSIDHHDTSRQFSQYLFCESDSAATGELVALLLHTLEVTVTKEMADALYTAVSTDTGCFQFANTTPRTHRIAAGLMAAGADWYELNQTMFAVKTPARIRLESALLGNIMYFFDDRIAVAVVSKAMRAETGATQDDMDGLSSLAYQIDGVEAGITVYEQSDGYKISLRTGATVNAGRVCAQFDGGGHNRAAGCHFTCGLEFVVTALVTAVRDELMAADLEEENANEK